MGTPTCVVVFNCFLSFFISIYGAKLKSVTVKNNARGRQIQPRHEDGDTEADADADADGGRYHNSENTQGLGMSVWADIKPTVNQPKMSFEINVSLITPSHKIPSKIIPNPGSKSQLMFQ